MPVILSRKGGGGGSGGAPSGPAGGVLSGTYPNPGFAVDMATQAELDASQAFVPPVSGAYITSQQSVADVDFGTASVQDRLDYTPIFISRSTTFDRITIYCQTLGAATVARLGLYTSDTDGKPDTLILDGGTVDTGGTGVLALTINQAAGPGLIFAACVVQGAAAGSVVLRRIAAQLPIFGAWINDTLLVSNPSSAAGVTRWNEAGVSAGLPASATPVAAIGATGGPVSIGLRAT